MVSWLSRSRSGTLNDVKSAPKTGLRICAALVLSGLGVYAVLWFASPWPARLHGMIVGACAVVFGFSERLFWNILSELNAAVRSTSLSVTEAERFRAVANPARLRMWRRWFLLTSAQVVAAASATLLISDYFSSVSHLWFLVSGYGAVFIAVPIMASFYGNYRKIELFRDDQALEEVKKKERLKLNSDLTKEPLIDHSADPQLEGYTRVAK